MTSASCAQWKTASFVELTASLLANKSPTAFFVKMASKSLPMDLLALTMKTVKTTTAGIAQ